MGKDDDQEDEEEEEKCEDDDKQEDAAGREVAPEVRGVCSMDGCVCVCMCVCVSSYHSFHIGPV